MSTIEERLSVLEATTARIEEKIDAITADRAQMKEENERKYQERTGGLMQKMAQVLQGLQDPMIMAGGAVGLQMISDSEMELQRPQPVVHAPWLAEVLGEDPSGAPVADHATVPGPGEASDDDPT